MACAERAAVARLTEVHNLLWYCTGKLAAVASIHFIYYMPCDYSCPDLPSAAALASKLYTSSTSSVSTGKG